MNNTRLLLLGAVVLVVLIAGAILFSNKTGTSTNDQTANPTPVTQESENTTNETMVNVTQNGFEPSTVTIEAGSSVVWTNKSGDVANVSSYIHPTHLLWPFLNLGTFSNGESVSVAFEKSGTYTYHNHLKPNLTGTVIVK